MTLLEEVSMELASAKNKHAPMHSPHEGHSVIREEVEELWEHVRADTGTSPKARKEAIQIAAMAIRYIEDLIDGRINHATVQTLELDAAEIEALQ